MDKLEISQLSKDTLVETFLDVMIDVGKDWIKEQGLSTIIETTFSLGLSSIPVLGNAISTFKLTRSIKNLEILVAELQDDFDALKRNLNVMSVEVKRDIDSVFTYMLEKTVVEKQEEKIKFFASSFVRLSEFQSIDVDISYIYYDTLSTLTALDLKVLFEMQRGFSYYYLNPEETPSIDISPEQLRAVKSNLERMGLIENQFILDVGKDIEKINVAISEYRDAIIEVQERLEKPKTRIHPIKSRTKSKVPKLKARNKLVLSNFGKSMIDFFGKVSER
ncbi:conserved protein of unknown function [Streptococcus thermophilus]|uniref:hypothetical protein n=1 Tax=Streptococcus thermophilus TaxID=1308 RepID=UPI0015C20D0B|nr:hypothetical protein [Streptococcus thermophilus]MCT2922862.1 hypothetical protein [Streptococcus thermophilus]CAD0161457.1 conserved protein of unknown function [Streptococcus thermophilus]